MRSPAIFGGISTSSSQPSQLSIDLPPTKFCRVPVRILVDSGATDSFVDSTFIETLGLKPSFLDTPVTLHLFDASPSSSPVLTHFVLWDLNLPKFPHIPWKLLVADLPTSHQIVVGHDFLQKWNPDIDWILGNLKPRTPSTSSPELQIHPPQLNLSALVSDKPGTPSPTSPNPARLRGAATGPLFDDDEEPDAIEDILRVVPKDYHDYVDVFSKVRAERLPPHRSYDHKFEFDGPLPPAGPIYSVSKPEQEVLKDYIDDLLAQGYIRPSDSTLGSPLLFAKKKDGSLRPVIDYRKINSVTRKIRYPIPPVNHLLEQVRHAKIYTKIDLRGAFNLIRMAEGHERYTTFRTRYGSFEYLVMPFGLANAPPTFQRMVNDMLHDFVDMFVVVYIDDILVYSSHRSRPHRTCSEGPPTTS